MYHEPEALFLAVNMGCGTSKASEIDEKCINIKPSPKKGTLGQTESNQVYTLILVSCSFIIHFFIRKVMLHQAM